MNNHAIHSGENRFPQQTQLEQILDLENMKQAWARVRSNKGSAGIDGMSVADFPAFSQVHILRILDQIREGRYAPTPVKTTQGVPSIRELWVRFKYGDKARA